MKGRSCGPALPILFPNTWNIYAYQKICVHTKNIQNYNLTELGHGDDLDFKRNWRTGSQGFLKGLIELLLNKGSFLLDY